MRRGKKIVVPGDGTSLWTMTHNSDLAKGFVGLMGNVRVIGHAFHITSDEVLTWDQIYRRWNGRGVQPDIVHVASVFIAVFDPDFLGSLIGTKRSAAFSTTPRSRLRAGRHGHRPVRRRRGDR